MKESPKIGPVGRQMVFGFVFFKEKEDDGKKEWNGCSLDTTCVCSNYQILSSSSACYATLKIQIKLGTHAHFPFDWFSQKQSILTLQNCKDWLPHISPLKTEGRLFNNVMVCPLISNCKTEARELSVLLTKYQIKSIKSSLLQSTEYSLSEWIYESWSHFAVWPLFRRNKV